MESRIVKRIKDESANSLVENVIILPLIFIVIYFLIFTAFIMHDRSTLEAAAKRGTIYASHCISNANYGSMLRSSGVQPGEFDVKSDITDFSFESLAKNVNPYRYIMGRTDVESATRAEVKAIIDKTKISWGRTKINESNITCKTENHFLYQDVQVSIDASYPLPKFFGAFGLETEYKYTVTAKTTVNDSDEFIRNADLVIDVLAGLDEKITGGKISDGLTKVLDKISTLTTKIADWFNISK